MALAPGLLLGLHTLSILLSPQETGAITGECHLPASHLSPLPLPSWTYTQLSSGQLGQELSLFRVGSPLGSPSGVDSRPLPLPFFSLRPTPAPHCRPTA